MSAGASGSVLRARSGSLREAPFEWLFRDASTGERTLALALRKRQIRKTIFFASGAPVECLSNLRHETLGQFLLGRGRISNAEFKDCLSEAAARELRIGEVLLERGLLDAAELAEALRQNLAYKLLECFTWQEGEYRIEPWMPDVSDAPPIQPARVLFTGITRFVPQDRILAATGPLLAHPVALTGDATERLHGLRLSPHQRHLVRRLRGPTDPHVLFQDEAVPRDELVRTLHAFAFMGIVAPADAEAAGAAAPGAPAEAEIDVEVDLSGLDAAPDPAALAAEIRDEHAAASGRRGLAFFGLPEGASDERVRERFHSLCRRYAPDRFATPALREVEDLAAELLHAATSAWLEVRGARAASAGPAPSGAIGPDPGAGEVREGGEDAGQAGELAGEYARQAGERMGGENYGAATGLLTLALRSDPAHAGSRIQLAYARFRESPSQAAESLAWLEEALAAAPDDALAHLYAAEIAHALEEFQRAEAHFRRGCALWSGEAR